MLVLDAQKEGKDIETSDLCVRIEALEASGAIAAAGPETAARVRRVLLDHDGREEGGGDL